MGRENPSGLYELTSEMPAGLRPDEGQLELLKRPPFFEEYLPLIEAYIGGIRPLQKFVREHVASMELEVTETDGHRPEDLFTTNLDAVYQEFANWGLPTLGMARFFNTGHQWVTVYSATLRNSSVEPREVLSQIRQARDELKKLYKPIGKSLDSVEKYNRTVLDLSIRPYLPEAREIWRQESFRAEKLEKALISRLDILRRGVLSISFVTSLLHRLAESERVHTED